MHSLSRRHFLASMSQGLSGIALGSLLHRDALASASAWAPPTGIPHFPAKAKSVIWLFMNGGVSHLESFDPKPMVTKYAGKNISETPFADVQKNVAKRSSVMAGFQRNLLYPLQVGFQKYGRSGIEVSDWFPHIGANIDKISVVRSMFTTDSNHEAQAMFHTGRNLLDGEFPSVGAWVHYGLGSLNENLPQYISIGKREYLDKKDSLYLGPAHNSVPLRIDPNNPIDFGRPERPVSAETQKLHFDLVRSLNQHAEAAYPRDPATAARVASYELAYRMQMSVPEIVNFSKESEHTKQLYGLHLPHCRDFGMQLLAARRFVEKGVRFIQIQHGGGGGGAWDAHSNLKSNHESNARAVDQPIGALLTDLDQRGLLEDTLVVFATEFGRTPGSEGNAGRDHHPFGFSIWMAGGGVKGGYVHGATDELGFHAVENRHFVTDVHATLLTLLGLDSRKLELPDRKRLAVDHGTPIRDIIA
ncbi:MAG: hypothetical protein RLZZ142_2145 [Verrucomicrobiota bacterium]